MVMERFAGGSPNHERDRKCQQAAEAAGFSDWWAWARSLEEKCGRSICGAPLRKKTKPCGGVPQANGRCRLHGGGSPIGPAHPSYINGQHSRFQYLPPNLQTKALETYSDPLLIEARDQLAVLDVHAKDLLERGLSTGESGEAWKRVAAIHRDLTKAVAGDDRKKVESLLDQLGEVAQQGKGEIAVWREYRHVIDDLRRQRETELTRMKHLAQFVSSERAATMFQRLIDIMQVHVTDTKTLRNILLDIEKTFRKDAEE